MDRRLNRPFYPSLNTVKWPKSTEGQTGKSNLFSGLIASFIKKGHARKPYLGRGEDERFASSTLTSPALMKSGSDYDNLLRRCECLSIKALKSKPKREEKKLWEARPSQQRRSFWLLSSPEILFVIKIKDNHYS